MILYAVDDEPFSTHIWYQFEATREFPGLSYRGTDAIADAIGHAATCEEPTLYVLDSRLPISKPLMEDIRRDLVIACGVDIGRYAASEVFNGVFAAAAIKARRPAAKVLILSGFANEIISYFARKELRELLAFGCDGILNKPCAEGELVEAVGQCLRDLAGT